MENQKKVLFAIRKGEKYLPEEHTWDYCIANKIPYILINPKIKYATVSCDLMSIDFGLYFSKEKSFSDQWEIHYNVYCDMEGIPDNKYSLIGGSNNLVFTIFKKDISTVMEDLIVQINDHVKKHGEIDPLRKEYYELNTRKNKMMNTLDYSVPWNKDEYDKLTQKQEEIAKKMDEKNEG